MGIFWGIQHNLEIRCSSRVSQSHSSANKVQPNLFLPPLFRVVIHNVIVETEDVLGCP